MFPPPPHPPPRPAIPAIIALTAALTLPSTACRPQPTPDHLDHLADHIRASLSEWDLPGLAVAVVHRDEVIFAEGFGVRELGRPDPVDERTLFQIGSVTKSFGAAAIGALVDDGLVGWDDPVVEHLPWFGVKDPEFTRRMTIRDLLAHTSGMPGDAFPVLAPMAAREVAERARLLDNFAPPGETHAYSNHGYGVAGLLVEEVTGMGWGEWVRERLFEPLGMRDSRASPFEVWDAPFVAPTFLGTAPAGTPSIADAPGRNVAMPHGVDRDGGRRVLAWQSYDNMQAAGSVVSSAAEMAKTEPRDWRATFTEHTGAIHEQVERTYAAQDSARVAGTVPTHPLVKYVGRYADIHGAGHAEVALADDGRLRLHFGPPGAFSGDLEHWNHDVFRLHFDGGDGQAYGSSFATFATDPRSGVTAVDLGFIGRYGRER